MTLRELLLDVSQKNELYASIYGQGTEFYSHTMMSTKLYITTCKLYNKIQKESLHYDDIHDSINDCLGYALMMVQKVLNIDVEQTVSLAQSIKSERESEYNNVAIAQENMTPCRIADMMLMKSIRIMNIIDNTTYGNTRIKELHKSKEEINSLLSEKLIDNLIDYIVYAHMLREKILG